MKKTLKSLALSTLSLLLCFVMLLGTTFAWFTDEIESGKNVIQAGNLDIEMYWTKDLNSGSWINAEDDNAEPVFNYDKWEPGYTEVRYVKIKNAGSLSFKYSLSIIPDGEVSKLADVIDVYFVENPTANIASRAELAALTAKGTLRDAIEGKIPANGILLSKDQSKANFYSGEIVVAIALKMRESAGNEYQNLSIGDTFSLKLSATQYSFETDAFGSDYDGNAAADFYPGFQGGSAGAAVTSDGQGITTSDVTMSGGDVSAVIPAGVMLADGVTSLDLTVTQKNASDANIHLSESEKMSPLDVHIEGVADGNTVPMLITLKQYLTTGINTGAIKMYHVENGVTVPMTHVANPTNHNEFSYDPSTGDVTLALASFSEVAVVADTNNPWDGETLDYTWYNASATELTIYNADQLAGFAAIVDGKAEDEGIAQDSFIDKTVKLANNIYLSGKLFDPIGWGYVNTEWNRGGVAGKVFQGTFDGNGKTIYDLYQNGWDLDPDKENYSNYTYTNCGFGLFAAASNATFKNLTINGASVTVECVEAGVLVGLSQNGCKYENIEIHNAKIANYQRPAGGLIGEVSGEGTTTITNVTIGSDVVVGSLWGDFDAPCGGVIGARWDDAGKNPQIVMQYVEVGARMDVYNDITSAYQWHAYRRAGMLIGNTEMTVEGDPHKAAAPFLTCLKDDAGNDTVKIYYGDWVNYTYCSFSNHNSRYPWVRTQAGENCEAFSNPRWGVPNDMEGNRVTDMNHVHKEGDECNVSRPFGQLYGGGQGVYGSDQHPGVKVIDYKYSITYINDGKVLDIVYVTDNTKAQSVANDQAEKLVLEWAKDNIEGGTIAFGGWMNAASIKLTEIPEKNTKNIVLYPYFNSPYTASFVDQNGNILAWCLFNDSDVSRLAAAFADAKDNLPDSEKDFELINWVVHGTNLKDGTVKVDLANDNTNWESFKGYKDVTITPKYRYKGADLIEVFDELTGEVDHYQVAGYAGGTGSVIVEIPAYVNGKPVTTVNADAFSSYDDLHSVRIPGTITAINSQSFTADTPDKWNDPSTWGEQRDTVTLYWEGDPAVWYAAMTNYNNKVFNDDSLLKQNWDNMMGEGSCVFFLNENGKVDLTKGYWELAYVSRKYVWQYHNHAYGSNSGCSGNEHNNTTNYSGQCDCKLCNGKTRPDAEYWTLAE